MTEHLYNSAGDFIAFRRSDTDKHVLDVDGNLIGWLPIDDTTVVTPDGEYFGTITDPSDRLLRRRTLPRFGRPGRPGRPKRPGRPVRPARRVPVTLPPGMTDLGSAA